MYRAAQGARLANSRRRSQPHLHTNHHRDLRLRSQPPHFASTAPFPFFHLSRSKCGGLPQPPPSVLAVVSEPPFFTEQPIVWMCRQTHPDTRASGAERVTRSSFRTMREEQLYGMLSCIERGRLFCSQCHLSNDSPGCIHLSYPPF